MAQFMGGVGQLYCFRTNLILKHWHAKELAMGELAMRESGVEEESVCYDHEYLEGY